MEVLITTVHFFETGFCLRFQGPFSAFGFPPNTNRGLAVCFLWHTGQHCRATSYWLALLDLTAWMPDSAGAFSRCCCPASSASWSSSKEKIRTKGPSRRLFDKRLSYAIPAL